MTSLRRRALRTWAFIGKETSDVFHQPRLLATLVIGPFLVMGAFGVGLSDQLPRFSALFVAAPGSDVDEIVDRYADELAGYIDYHGVIDDEEEALQQLAEGRVDVVAVLPTQPIESIRNDRRAVIEVYHRSLDPIVGAAIEGAARLAADEINRQVLASIIAEGQSATVLVDDVLPRVASAVAATRSLLEVGDRAAAESRIAQLRPELDEVVEDVSNTLSLADGLGRLPGAIAGDVTPSSLRRAVRRLSYPASIVSIEERIEQLAVVEQGVAAAQTNLETLRDVRPEVLIRPFRARTQGIEQDLGSPLAFYVPSILVLLLQHLGVTFAALALVRERDLGAVELFAVAPVTSGEILLGKSISYLLLGAAVAVTLIASTRTTLGIPFSGSLVEITAGLVAVLLASVGVGFLISLVSGTHSQAVQLAMLVLLASFFFSGFFVPLDRLGPVAGYIGAVLPATHGISIGRDVMLRGNPIPGGDVLQLGAIAAVGLIVTWRGFARQLTRG